MTNQTYPVVGMTCSHCVAAVTEELAALEGVTAISVDLVEWGASAVTVSSDRPLDPALVAEAVAEAGYAVA